MLILTRRIGESVYIGDEVRLTVLGVRGTQVRIGINAPKDIPVHREEIYYKIKHEQSGGGQQAGNELAAGQHAEDADNAGNAVAPADFADAAKAHDDSYYDDDQSLAEEADPNNA